ncbi:MAG TPA: GNAT family N-acyltransferase [Quisquiliibacterium sp.]|nr:GNAT family N-acyltransferase [Quisquiliibacterium sp.]HQP65556.1 GNAT family N-acyltransferase [Quisquiliibacterium sp.]
MAALHPLDASAPPAPASPIVLTPPSAPPLASAGSLEVRLAERPDEIEQAMRLRYRVFRDEFGAHLPAGDGLDRDLFDRHCHHLIVRDRQRDAVVGTYRVLLPERARRIGRLYTEDEFWLTRLNPIRDELVELGRSCVHPDYRTGGVILLLWSGLGAFLSQHAGGHVIGCVSVPMHDGGAFAARLYRRLAREHLADETLRVWPRDRLPIEDFPADEPVVLPPLMKGYLRCGARLLGEPHRDDAFGCADFPMMLSLERLDARYQRRFM